MAHDIASIAEDRLAASEDLVAEDSLEGIWPPYEAFYIEAMLFCTKSAVSSLHEINSVFGQIDDWPANMTLDPDVCDVILDGFQNIAAQGAALSRYLWPSRKQEPHKSRATQLRESLNVDATSPLRDRGLRNQMEHFDERLDLYLRGGIVGNIIPKYVGPFLGEPQVPTHVFRAYYTDTLVFEVLGERYEMQPVVEEISRLNGALSTAADSGFRLRSGDHLSE